MWQISFESVHYFISSIQTTNNFIDILIKFGTYYYFGIGTNPTEIGQVSPLFQIPVIHI